MRKHNQHSATDRDKDKARSGRSAAMAKAATRQTQPIARVSRILVMQTIANRSACKIVVLPVARLTTAVATLMALLWMMPTTLEVGVAAALRAMASTPLTLFKAGASALAYLTLMTVMTQTQTMRGRNLEF